MLNIKCFVVNPIQENTYIVSDATKEAVIIDCGAYFPSEKAEIEDFIREEGLNVKHLLLTHSHFDHTFGNSFVLETYHLTPEGYGGKEISFGEHRFQVIHTPGHAKDAVVFFCPEEKIAFTGDTVFQNSIGRTDLEGGNYHELEASIVLLKQIIPDDTKLYPGHGPSTTMGEEKLMNPFFEGQ